MITLIDYKAGNLTSVKRALDHLGIPNQISADPQTVINAERVIFPGVGAAGAAMGVLKERGLDSALKECFAKGTPILGICIGCQIILTRSEEGDTPCLDLLPGACVRFRVSDPALKIPHMGWNAVSVLRPHPLLGHLHPGDEFYFVAAIGRDNLFAVQFHAEKSGPVGLKVLENFSQWKI